MNTPFKPTAFVVTIALLGAVAQTAAHAEEAAANADKRAVTLVVQRDARSNQSAAAAGSLAVGSHAWVQAGVGQSRGEQGRDEGFCHRGAFSEERAPSVGSRALGAGRTWTLARVPRPAAPFDPNGLTPDFAGTTAT